jgi:hypothetical protein
MRPNAKNVGTYGLVVKFTGQKERRQAQIYATRGNCISFSPLTSFSVFIRINAQIIRVFSVVAFALHLRIPL